MKRALQLLCISLFITNFLPAQTVVFSEDWTSGGTGWTLNVVTGPEGADPNFWKVSAEEGGGLTPGSCGVANNGNNTLFITSVANPTGGAAYDAGGACGVLFCPQADRRTESPVINCTGKSNLTLNFIYIENGDGTNDNATVWYNDGTGWVLLNDPAKTTTCGSGQGTWTSYTFSLPASANNNPNVKIAFRWVNNDDGIGTDPSFAVDNITITTPASVPVVSITPSPNDTICKNATLTLNGSATNGPITKWAWTVSPKTGVVFNPDTTNQNPTVTFTTAGTYTFTLFATSAGGTGSNTQVITVLPNVVPSVVVTPSAANPVCAGTSITFTATPTNGGTSPSYQWQVNAVNMGTNSTVFGPNTYTNGEVVSVTMTSNATCVSPVSVTTSYTVQVINPVAPTVTVTPNPASGCAGGSITFTATPTNGGTTPAYQWVVNGSNAGTNTSTFTLSNIAGGELVSVVLTSNATCISASTANSNTVVVSIVPSPTITIKHGMATVCPGIADTLVAAATAGSTFSWSPAAGLNMTNNDTVIATHAAVGAYTYYVTATKGGCSRTDSVTVTVSSVLSGVTAGPGYTVCAGHSAPLSVTGGTDWQWLPSSTVSCDTCKNTTATPTVTTTYSVIASNGSCVDTVKETITVIPKASVSFNTHVITPGIPQTIGFTNTSTNALGYYWTFGDNLSSVLQTPAPHTYNGEGTYTVVLIAYGNNGCNDTLSTLVVVTDTVGVTVPNIFTPNGDNINDVFKPSVHGVKSFECTIYDRWGLKVYEFAGAQDHWDGYTTAGLPCIEGTYYYILKATDNNNKSYDLKGYLTLIH
jgi:gliding motility-associated-like protein